MTDFPAAGPSKGTESVRAPSSIPSSPPSPKVRCSKRVQSRLPTTDSNNTKRDREDIDTAFKLLDLMETSAPYHSAEASPIFSSIPIVRDMSRPLTDEEVDDLLWTFYSH
ncbi:hypothetical protein NPIL_81881 [Nephila pilipes]|uniref:Uncharacterized protein n=1 Tax=Nephila pilipes TaxID=299642 RepID=A0A8X6TLH8_NEPPI|nr:hypothetical protein NPIL_81881 [Nephila pilipes]